MVRYEAQSDDRFSLQGRCALITGASSGLGWHFAGVLAAAGAKVCLCARRKDLLAHRVSELERAGYAALAIPMDVTDGASVAAAFAAAEDAFGAVEIVVNNAGVADQGPFHEVDEARWRRVMEVNQDGVFRVAREAANRMRTAGNGGSIVNIASVLGHGVLPGVSAYAVSKAAVIQLTKAMALELARDSIRVNALAPGYFATEMNADFLASEAGAKLVKRVPQRRVGEPGELDGPLLLLASGAGGYMTGSVLIVDGGAHLSFA